MYYAIFDSDHGISIRLPANSAGSAIDHFRQIDNDELLRAIHDYKTEALDDFNIGTELVFIKHLNLFPWELWQSRPLSEKTNNRSNQQ